MRARKLPDESRNALEALAADTSGTGRSAFMAALRDFHAAGWSYRQLGSALGQSHENIRRLIAASDGAPSPISPPWESPAKPTVLEAQELPQDIADDLQARLLAAVKPGLGTKDGPLSSPVAALYAGLAGAVAAGWDAHEIGTAVGIHPKAVSRFAAAYARQPVPEPIPAYRAAPDRGEAAWNAKHPALPPVVISDQDRERLTALRDDASASRAAAPAASEYTRILTTWYLLGASREELEQATGQQWTTLRRRLLRWGVMRDPRKA